MNGQQRNHKKYKKEPTYRFFFITGRVIMDLFDTNTTFERQLFAKAARNRIPLYGVLELLPLCNLNCDMCYVHLSKQEMQSQGRLRSLDEWISLAKQMKDAGTLFLLLTGGEPLLFPQFKELYCALKDMGMILTLNTNGTLINEEWAEFFAKNKPRRINITLYGSKNETYEKLCHMKDGFDKTIRGIELLKKYKIDVKINRSLVKKNFHERLNPEDAAKARVEILHREMGDELFEQYAKQTIYLAEHTEEGDACPGHMTCRAGQSSFVINWQGMIRSCVVLDQPSYDAFDTTDDFMTLWNKIVKETEEIKTSMECNQCKLRHVCNTCAAAAIAECGDSEGVSKYLCEYTKETVSNLKEFY